MFADEIHGGGKGMAAGKVLESVLTIYTEIVGIFQPIFAIVVLLQVFVDPFRVGRCGDRFDLGECESRV